MLRSPLLRGAGVLALFAALTVWTGSLLIGRIDRAIPGTHFGDNAAALWNVWWFTTALADGHPVFRTSMLFAPAGTQLSLHTHATTHSAVAWVWTFASSVVASHNLAILCGILLNGVCAFALARVLTDDESAPGESSILPSMLAGTSFALSAFVQVRLLGHINLLHAWVLPVFALAILRLDRKPHVSSAASLGAAAALVAYTDYYYFLYALLLTALWAIARLWAPTLVWQRPRAPRMRSVLVTLMVIDLLLIVTIASTTATAIELGPVHVSLRGLRNPMTVFWVLALAWLACRFPFRVAVSPDASRPASSVLRLGMVAVIAFALLAAPLLVALGRVIAAGDYTAPRILWRSSPPGADLLTLLLGHPLHVLTGTLTRSAYQTLGIDVMEQSLWLGVVPIVVVLTARRQWSRRSAARFCAVVALVFCILALGPFLRVGGADTALPLPYAALRYVPGFSNARIPGRAAVMVDLAAAMLVAFAVRERRRWTPLVAVLLLIETLPAPVAVQPIPPPDAVDARLRESREPGAVVEMPTGLRDGFGESGRFDHRALIHQMWHGRPLVGGFVARLPSSVRKTYAESPVLTSLVDLSAPGNGEHLHAGAAHDALTLGISFIVINRDTSVADRLPRSELEDAGFALVEIAGPRELYRAGADRR